VSNELDLMCDPPKVPKWIADRQDQVNKKALAVEKEISDYMLTGVIKPKGD